MTPGYPKYYIGDSVCRWTLYAARQQKIKLTILDLALRCKYYAFFSSKVSQWLIFGFDFPVDEPCRDYVEIRDLETNQTLFSSCSESTRPLVVISVREKVEVS